LSAHETIGGLRLVFSEIGCIADRTKEYSEQKTAVATTIAAGKASHQGELTRARSRLIGCSSRPIKRSPIERRDEILSGNRNVRFWPKADMPKNAIDVAIGGKADMTFCSAHVCF